MWSWDIISLACSGIFGSLEHIAYFFPSYLTLIEMYRILAERSCAHHHQLLLCFDICMVWHREREREWNWNRVAAPIHMNYTNVSKLCMRCNVAQKSSTCCWLLCIILVHHDWNFTLSRAPLGYGFLLLLFFFLLLRTQWEKEKIAAILQSLVVSSEIFIFPLSFVALITYETLCCKVLTNDKESGKSS